MKKALTSILVLLIIVIIASPFGIGVMARKKYNETWQELADNSNIKLQVIEEKAGFLSSSNKIRLRFPIDLASIDIESKIHHGPIAFKFPGKKGGLSYAQIRSTISAKMADETYQLPGFLDQTFSFPSGATFQYHFAAGNHGFEKVDVDYQDMNLNVEVSDGNEKLSAKGLFNGLLLSDDDGALSVGKVTLDSSMSKSKFDVWIGGADYVIESMAFEETAAGAPIFELNGASLGSSAKLNGELVSYDIGAKAAKLNIAEARDMAFDFKLMVENLHAPSLATFQEALPGAMSGEGGPQSQIAMTQSADGMLSKGVSLRVPTFSLQTPSGELSGSFNLSLPASDGGLNPLTIMSDLQGDAAFRIPKILAHRLAAQRGEEPGLQILVDQNMLVAAGNFYELQAELEGGQLFVNGTQIPIPMGALPL